MATFRDAERPYDAPSPQRPRRRAYIDPVDGPQPSEDDYDYPDDRLSAAEQARLDWLDSHPDGRPEMVEFASDNAAATLSLLEEGCLRGLASLGTTSVADLAEFCAGFCRSAFTDRDMGHALFALDALGWAIPEGGTPLVAGRWLLTEHGRSALDRR